MLNQFIKIQFQVEKNYHQQYIKECIITKKNSFPVIERNSQLKQLKLNDSPKRGSNLLINQRNNNIQSINIFVFNILSLVQYYEMNASDFFCGLLAGWSQVIVGQPFDFLKEVPILTIAKDIRENFGIKGFYRGSSSLFFGFAFTIGTEFLVFQWAKKLIFRTWGQRQHTNYNLSKLKIWEVATAGFFVGWSVSGIYCPVEYVKIQKQLGSNIQRSAIGLLFKQMRQNGVKNIFKGYWTTVARQSIGSFFYYGSYETFVRSLARQGRENASTMDFFLAGGLAGLTFHLLTYPIDTIKTNIQNGQSFRYSIKAAFQYSKLKGYKVVLTRAALVNSISFLVYEKAQLYISDWGNFYYSMY